MPLVTDVTPQEIAAFTRRVSEEERFQFGLQRFLPNVRRISDQFSFVKGDPSDVDSATVRQYNTPAPIAKRKGFTRVYGSIPPISEKIPLTEEQKIRLQAQLTGDASGIRRQIFDDMGNRVRAVNVRIERFRGEALETGKLTIAENGVTGIVDFNRDASMATSAAIKWDQAATAVPLKDMTTWINTYYDLNFTRPGLVVASFEVMQALLTVDSLRSTAGSILGTPQILDQNTVEATFARQGFPPFFIYDGRAKVNGSQVRILNQKKILLLPPASEPLGETQFIPTAEGLDYAGAGMITTEEAANITGSVWTTEDPAETWTKAAANVAPVLANANLVMAITVLT